MKTEVLAAACLLACASTAHAGTSSAEFKLTEPPSFALQDVPAGSDPSAAGRWTGPADYNFYTRLTNGLSETTESFGTTDGKAFGNPVNNVVQLGAARLEVDYHIGSDVLKTSAHLDDPQSPASSFSILHWLRPFEINPHSSVTLAGMANFSGDGVRNAFTGATLPDGKSVPIGYLGVVLGNGNGGVSIGVDITTPLFDPTWTDPYAMVAQPDGWLSLTINNVTDHVQTGKFHISVDNSGVPAVPEPQTIVLLLSGLGIMGMVARRRSPSHRR